MRSRYHSPSMRGGEWGWQLKTLDITFAGGRKPLRLFIEAEVE